MWLEAPNSSAAPHFDGHHGCALSFGAAGCACAAETGASEYLPCIGPAKGAARAAPDAPTAPAVFRKARRFGDAGELSGVSVGSVIAVPPSDARPAAAVSVRTSGSAMENYPIARVECPGHEQPVRLRP